MSTVEEIFGAPRRKGCAVCGAQNAYSVQVRISELDAKGAVAKGSRTKTHTKSLCADHAAETFGRLRDSL
jgi:hypothetical protein